MAKCVVFGGNGFIGSHLIDRLVADGHKVTCFTRSATSDINNYKSAGVVKITGDFMNRADVESAVAGQDYVFHFISTTTPATAENDPVFDLKTNVTASVELFQSCVNNNVKKVFFASTGGSIYGENSGNMLNEAAPTLPVSPYAIGKLTIENYLRYFEAKYGLGYCVFRISNPYGTRQARDRKQGVIPIFLQATLRGEPVTVYGDGSMIRDYIYVEDVVGMVAGVVGKANCHSTYNLGSGEGVSVNHLIETIEATTGQKLQIKNAPKPKTFVQDITLDTERFSNEFGIDTPLTRLSEGIGRLWAEMKDQQ